MSGVEHHDAFEIQFLDEVVKHRDRPDYSLIHVEVRNKLPMVSIQLPF